MGGLIDLQKYVLRKIFGFGGVGQRPVNQVHDRLFVFLDQCLKSIAIALLYTQHQGGIRVAKIPGHRR